MPSLVEDYNIGTELWWRFGESHPQTDALEPGDMTQARLEGGGHDPGRLWGRNQPKIWCCPSPSFAAQGYPALGQWTQSMDTP